MAFNKGVGISLTYDEVKEYVQSLKLNLLSTEYIRNDIKLDLKCEQGHTFKKSVQNLQIAPFCNECNKNAKNLKSYEYMKKNFEIRRVCNDIPNR